ncbi:MAG TPA: SDR family oxidoreductase [Myxococcota bacterium]|nr:SDR family oxidoreductase [Myxococcota bacterium]
MPRLCEGRIVVITGAGRGIGRGYALEFARQGAKVIVNDLGGAVDGTGATLSPAQLVVEEIRKSGGLALANGEDVADWEGAQRLIASATETFGGLDVLVNNAGILRDRMLFNMSPEEWDSVIRVHLRGTFCTTRHAASYWRDRAKSGRPNQGRVINTTSVSGLYGNAGQTNYGAAKAGIAAFTIIAAKELERFGVTVNAISPGALTRMTENLRPGASNVPAQGFDPRSPDNIAPIAVWLGSLESSHVTGRVFEVSGGRLCISEGWTRGPEVEHNARWDPAELGPVVRNLLEKARPAEPMSRRANAAS